MPLVKCVDCGYLSRHSPLKGEFHEILAFYRKSGSLLLNGGSVGCFRGMADLHLEGYKEVEGVLDLYDSDLAETLFRSAVRMAIDKERDCDGFYSFSQGHSPKEHLSIQRGQEWEQSMAKEQREWQGRMQRKTLIWGIIATVIVTAIATLSAPFLPSLFQ